MFTITVLANVPPALVNAALSSNAEFEKLTRDFCENRLVTTYLFQRSVPLKTALGSGLFKRIFADVRGVVLDGQTLIYPRDCQFATRSQDPIWATSIVKNVKHLFTDNDPTYEITASYMLDGRALYMTALGPQTLDTQARRLPLTFLLCVHSEDAENPSGQKIDIQQLGRLLDRMHLLSTLRHAALLDLELLRKASASLTAMDRFTEEARAAIARYDRDEHENDREVRGRLNSAREKLDAITSAYYKVNQAGVGLTFRIESARYYVSQFEKNLPALRLGRVEGYRRYDHFIERWLGASFEFINRIGVRYERAANVIAEINDSFQTVQTRKTGERVADIQRYGELVLLTLLVPYYFLGTIEHLFAMSKEPKTFVPIFLVVVGVVAYACLRFVNSLPNKKWFAQVAVPAFIASVAFAITMITLVIVKKNYPIDRDYLETAIAETGAVLLAVLSLHALVRASKDMTYYVTLGLAVIGVAIYCLALREAPTLR